MKATLPDLSVSLHPVNNFDFMRQPPSAKVVPEGSIPGGTKNGRRQIFKL